MSVTISVDKIKSAFIPELKGTSDDDSIIEDLIEQITNQVVDYLDDSTVTGRATIPSACEWPMMKQISFEYRRRKDPGLSSVTFPDGTIQKYNDGELLRDFREVLNRHRKIHVGG
jgi:hypothetical protein